MAGTYQEGQTKTLSGVYSLVQALANNVIGGSRGIVALPFTADWGPVNTLVTLARAPEFDTTYHTSTVGNGQGKQTSAQKVRFLAYKGSPSKVLGYRMATSSAATGTADLGGGWTLETVYPSERPFTAVVKAGIAEGSVNVQIVENGVLLLSVEDAAVDSLTNKLNASGLVKVKAGGSALPAVNAGIGFTGGNNGSAVTAAEYLAFMTEVEADKTANYVALDGVTDEAILASLDAWVRRVRDEGFYVTAVRGGASDWDTQLALANTKSKSINYRGIINVGNGLDGFTGADMAVFIAAYSAALPLNQGLTDQPVPFDAVNAKTPLTLGNRIAAAEAGTLLFIMEGGRVLIDEDVNTLTSATGLESNEMGSIRVSVTIDYVVGSLEAFGNEYKRTKSNTQPARQAYAAIVEEEFFKPLARMEVIQPDYSYKEDPDYHGKDPVFTPKLNQAFFYSTFTPVDSMEQIYQKFGVKFS